MVHVNIYSGGPRSSRSAMVDRRFLDARGTARLLLPTRAAARARFEALLRAQDGPGMIGRPVLELTDFVVAILAGEGEVVRRLGALERRWLLERCLRELAARGEMHGFGGTELIPGLVSHLLRVITQLKQAAIEPETFAARTAESGDPLDALVAAAYGAYQAALVGAGAYDVPGLYWRAEVLARAQRPRALAGVEVLLYDGFDDFTPSEFRLLRALADHVEMVGVGLNIEPNSQRTDLYRLPRAAHRRLVAELGAVDRACEQDSPRSLSAYLADHIFWRDPPPRAVDLQRDVAVVACIDPQHEAETIGRAIKTLLRDAHVAPREIAVVYRNLAPRLGLLKHVFAEYGIPLRAAASIMLRQTSLGAFVSALFSATTLWEREAMADVLDAPWWGGSLYSAAPLGCRTLARMALILEGESAWRERLALFVARPGEEDAARAAAEMLGVRVKQIGEALAAWPARLPVAKHAARLRALLEGIGVADAVARTEDAEAHAAWSALGGLMALLEAEQGADVLTLSEFAALLDRALQETSCVETTVGDGVAALDATAARNRRFRHVFLAGLNEGQWPTAPGSSAIYGEPARVRLREQGIELEGRQELSARELLLFQHVLGVATDSLTLSWSVNIGGREASPSPYLTEVIELIGDIEGICTPPPQAADILPAPGTVASLRDARNLAFAGGQQDEVLAQAFPAVARGADMERSRYGFDAFDQVDGVLAGPDMLEALAVEFGPDHIFSVNQLETYLGCPFRFFVERVLGVREIESPEADFDPRLRGLVAHSILQRFHEQFRGQSLADIPQDVAQMAMLEHIAASFEDHIWRNKAAPMGLVAMERARMTRQLERYLVFARAVEFARWKPVEFEFAFGRAGAKAEEPARAEFVLDTDSDVGPIRFAGRIDRIDRLQPVQGGEAAGESLRIVDYKTGSAPRPKDIGNGTAFQLTLYAWAMERHLFPGSSCARADYIALGQAKVADALQSNKPRYKDREANTLQAIIASVAGIRRGEFPPRPSVQECHGCTAAHICRHEQSRIARKPGTTSVIDGDNDDDE